jgi:tRNA(Ile)-lysidine synthase
MLSKFITYIQEEELFRISRDKILLAVSGGKDSAALLYLSKKAGLKFGIAHCNFQLRGKESDEDEKFVETLAKEAGVEFYCNRFEVKTEVETQKKSVQTAARDLRYKWFEQLRTDKDYQYIAVAHHHNDSIETLLFNLTKGCGIRGLHGILPKNGKIIRPMLFANREDIDKYVEENNIKYREDSSNSDTKYRRNALRHLVVPELKKINPELEKTFVRNFRLFRQTETLYKYAIDHLTKKVLQINEDSILINIQAVVDSPAPSSLMYELLTPYNFKKSKIEYIFRRRNEEPGAIYSSSTHDLLRDRTEWIIKKKGGNRDETFEIAEFGTEKGSVAFADFVLNWKINPLISEKINDNNIACFDYDKITFPLHLRHWRDGDYLYPSGMEGKKKKLSKYFKDLKINRFDKDKIWLICNAGEEEIIWVTGLREDERFKVDDTTKKVLQLEIQDKKNGDK